jgi:cysteine desulfurase/selenocysteine lyase
MSPSDPGNPTSSDDLKRALSAMSEMMRSLPDAAALERMANQMFSGTTIEPVSADPTRGGQELPATIPGFGGVPEIPQLQTMPAIPSFGEPWAVPGLQGAVAGPPVSVSAGSYYFLDEAFGALGTMPLPRPEAFGMDASRVGALGLTTEIFDPQSVRRDFPILEEQVHGRRLIWLDNGATTQKPQSVIDRLKHFYEHENSNIHRAAHTLAGRSTDAYEAAREKVRRFLNASTTREIVFVRGATEAINLVAQSFGRRHVERGDEVVITWLEHHSNIVPWQLLCAERGARLRVAPVDDRGQLILEEYEKLLGPKTRLVAFTHVSNALGTVMPVREMTEMAHRYGARVLIDGAQAVAHIGVDVQLLDCDFYAFSGHKIFAPTGIGVLFGKADLLDAMPPWQGGGSMISDVTFEKTIYQQAPQRFEAGTGNIADAVGLGTALDYVQSIGLPSVARHEHDLMDYLLDELQRTPGIRIIGMPAERAGVVSFLMDGVRPEDVGAALDREGIAVRAGHHCAQPALRRFGTEATVRPSLALYNTCEDVDALIAALRRIQNGRG